jgi:hypothetical protein
VTEYLSFEGRIDTVTWGRADYTILRLPDAIASQLRAQGAKRVEGEIAEYPVNLALTKAPVVEGVFLWTGQTLLDRVGLTPGATVDVRLRPAPADIVDLPPDVAAALRAVDAVAIWEGLSAGKRRGHLYQVDSAKTAPTRGKRIAKLIAALLASVAA